MGLHLLLRSSQNLESKEVSERFLGQMLEHVGAFEHRYYPPL
jgi:hypothetical protein